MVLIECDRVSDPMPVSGSMTLMKLHHVKLAASSYLLILPSRCWTDNNLWFLFLFTHLIASSQKWGKTTIYCVLHLHAVSWTGHSISKHDLTIPCSLTAYCYSSLQSFFFTVFTSIYLVRISQLYFKLKYSTLKFTIVL